MGKTEGQNNPKEESKPFESLDLDAMEKAIADENAAAENEAEDQEEAEESDDESKDSESSEETSEESDKEGEQESDEADNSDEEDEQESEESSDEEETEEEPANLEQLKKSYKSLQAEFTRRNQKHGSDTKALETQINELKAQIDALQNPEQDESDSKQDEEDPEVAEFRKSNPKGAKILDKVLGKQVKAAVDAALKPLQQKVSASEVKENVDAFKAASDLFKASDLKELEPELTAIYNENPKHWARLVASDATAFEQLKKEMVNRHLTKVTQVLAKKGNTTGKKKVVQKAVVLKKGSETNPVKGKMSVEDFSKLSLEDMEKQLPKAD